MADQIFLSICNCFQIAIVACSYRLSIFYSNDCASYRKLTMIAAYAAFINNNINKSIKLSLIRCLNILFIVNCHRNSFSFLKADLALKVKPYVTVYLTNIQLKETMNTPFRTIILRSHIEFSWLRIKLTIHCAMSDGKAITRTNTPHVQSTNYSSNKNA